MHQHLSSIHEQDGLYVAAENGVNLSIWDRFTGERVFKFETDPRREGSSFFKFGVIGKFRDGEYAVFFSSKYDRNGRTTYLLNTVKLYWNEFSGEWLISSQLGESLSEEPVNMFAIKAQEENSVSCIIHFKGTKILEEYRECDYRSFYENEKCVPCESMSFTTGF